MSSCSLKKVKDPFGRSPMDLMRLIHVSWSHTYCIRKIRSSMCKVQQTPNQLPIQCIIYHRRRICFFKLNSWKEGSLAWFAIFHVELVQQIQNILGLMCLYSMLGLSNFETQKLAQQSQICHKKCMVHCILQGGNLFLWTSCNQKVSKYNTIIIK